MDFPQRPCSLSGVWRFSRGFPRLSAGKGQVPYVLLTRAPVAGGRIAAPPMPLDLHVLGLSLAFILSQDQTLRCCYLIYSFFLPSCRAPVAAPRRPEGIAPRDPKPRARSVRLRSLIYLELTRTPAGVPLLAAARLCTARRTPFVFVISSVASFQCPPPDRPVLRGRRSCKGNNFFPFRKTLTGFFSAAGTAVPRLRLQRYYHFSLKTKFFPNFFQKKFTLFSPTHYLSNTYGNKIFPVFMS